MPLNPEQRDVLRTCFKTAEFRARALANNRVPREIHDSIAADADLSNVTRLVGPAGAGKSEIIRSLKAALLEAKAGRVLVTAHMGAASAPFGGPTINSLMDLKRDGHREKNSRPWTRRRLLNSRRNSRHNQASSLRTSPTSSLMRCRKSRRRSWATSINDFATSWASQTSVWRCPSSWLATFLSSRLQALKSFAQHVAEDARLDVDTPTAVGQATSRARVDFFSGVTCVR